MAAVATSAVPTQTQCGYCNIALQDTDQQSTLLCGDKVHSTCFIRQMCIDSPRYLQCPTCHGPITPASFLQEHLHIQANNNLQVSELTFIDEDNSQAVYAGILQKFNDEPEFREAVIKYYKQLRKSVTARGLFRKLVTQRRRIYKGQIAPLRDAIVELKKETIKSIKTTDEYKLYITRSRSANTLAKLIRRKYNIRAYHIQKAIINTPSIRKWPKFGFYNESPRYILRRAFRFN